MASPWVVVGISGVTNGGKSTTTQKLQSRLPCHTRVIAQDDYFYPDDSPHHVPCPGDVKHHNFEILSALDTKMMMRDVLQIINSQDNHTKQSPDGGKGTELSPILLLDGFILYDHPEILELCDLRYFFTLGREDCWDRRVTREYDPPDPPGYFDACVWPMYEEHLAKVKEQVSNVVYLDGMQDNVPLILEQVSEVARLKKKKEKKDRKHSAGSEAVLG